MIRKLAHACLETNDLPRATRFYSEVLGLPVQFTFKNDRDEIFGHYFACGDTTFVEIFDHALKVRQWGGEVTDLRGAGRVSHLCLEVTDLPAFRSALESRGAAIGPISKGFDGSLQAWLADPDGNPIELMEYTHRSLQLQPNAPDCVCVPPQIK
jgi:catechol 2,3-dioxygenase-like lactoylglutathione lyase family enzyme